MLGHAVIHLARDYIKEKNQQIARNTYDGNSCIQNKVEPLRKENSIDQY